METIHYITSIFTFYMKGEIAGDQDFIRLKDPNSILGLIPLGAKTESISVNQIASTKTDFKLRFGKLLVGIMLASTSLGMMNDSGSYFFLLLISINIILNAFEADLVISTTSGEQRRIDFFIFEKGKAQEAAQAINSLIANRLHDTNMSQQTDRIVDAINNK